MLSRDNVGDHIVISLYSYIKPQSSGVSSMLDHVQTEPILPSTDMISRNISGIPSGVVRIWSHPSLQSNAHPALCIVRDMHAGQLYGNQGTHPPLYNFFLTRTVYIQSFPTRPHPLPSPMFTCYQCACTCKAKFLARVTNYQGQLFSLFFKDSSISTLKRFLARRVINYVCFPKQWNFSPERNVYVHKSLCVSTQCYCTASSLTDGSW